MLRGKNKIVALHPEGSAVVTLDLCIEHPASPASPTSPASAGSTATASGAARTSSLVTKSMAREEKEASAKTLDRVRLLFAPPRSAVRNCKKVSRDEILAACPAVHAFCRTSRLDALAEGGAPWAAPGTTPSPLSASHDASPLYTELNPELPNCVFWQHAEVLQVGDTDVTVLYNVPTVTSVTPPGVPYVGLPLVCADVSVLFASQESVCYEWCVLGDSASAPAGGARGVHGDAASGASSHRVLSRATSFTPTPDLVGKAMLLRVSLSTATGLWTEVRLPDVVRPLPPPVTRWQETASAVNYPAFRVVTYNILHDDFCTSKSSKAKIYPFATDDILDLENRKVRIVQELLAYHTDLICLQECGRDLFQAYLLPVLRACGFDGTYFNKSGNVKEGCALLFRASRFELIDAASVPLNFATLSSMFPALAGRVGACPELRESIAAVTSIGARVVLRERTSGRELVVGNTHLFYHANGCHIRILQAYMLLHWLHNAAVATTPQEEAASAAPRADRALVLCGDFNCTHPTGAYRLLTTGQVEASHPSWDKGKLFWWGCARLLGYDAERLEELLGEDTVLPQATVARKDFRRRPKASPNAASPAEPSEGAAEGTAAESAQQLQQQQQESSRRTGDEAREVTHVFREALYGPPMRMQDAYQRTDPSLPWTNFTLTFREVIDYILFSEDSLEVLRTVPIPPESELAENFALPNKKYPSDHVSLIADLVLVTRP